MKQAALQELNNEHSYTDNFFGELYSKLNLKDPDLQYDLKERTISAAETYLRYYGFYETELPPHKMRKELQKALNHINKAKSSLNIVYQSGNYDREMAYGLHEAIDENHPLLRNLLREIIGNEPFIPSISPEKALTLLSAVTDGIECTLEKHKPRNTTTKSRALNRWLVVLSSKLELVLKRKIEQSRYHNGEYISKRELSDADLLQFIINPIDPNVTISQLETAIKETHKERNTESIYMQKKSLHF